MRVWEVPNEIDGFEVDLSDFKERNLCDYGVNGMDLLSEK